MSLQFLIITKNWGNLEYAKKIVLHQNSLHYHLQKLGFGKILFKDFVTHSTVCTAQDYLPRLNTAKRTLNHEI